MSSSKTKWIKLSEMAKLLNRSAKQFRKDVAKQMIPHIILGKTKMFDQTEVENFLRSQTTNSAEIEVNKKNKRRKTSNSPKNKSTENLHYKELLGLK